MNNFVFNANNCTFASSFWINKQAMENPYIKQFPDLMAGKKIMYVHGFLSSAQSGTVKMLQETDAECHPRG